MRCLYNGPYPCGKCPMCMANRQRAFMFRLDQEKDHCSFYYWLTLQYSDECVPRFEDGEMCFSKSHCHGFFEKLRKRYADQDITFKHFLVSEYGPNSTHRPHYHVLLMVYCEKSFDERRLLRDEMKEFIIQKGWPFGHVTEKSFHGRVLRYLTKYCCKPEMIGQYHRMKPFTLISRGIGLSYLETLPALQIEQMKNSLDFSVRYGSGKMQLPRYYVDKILPHSLNDLMNCETVEDFTRLSEIRSRMSRAANAPTRLRVQRAMTRNDLDQDFLDWKKGQRITQATWNDFKSKINQRKDL